LDTAIALNRDRYDVTIVTAGLVGHLGKTARECGLRVVGLTRPNEVAEYEDLLRNFKISIAISHFSDIGYPLFAKYKIPNITFIHNVYAFLSPEQAQAFRENDRYVDCYISVSLNATRFAERKFRISATKIITVPNGLIIPEHEARIKRSSSLSRQKFGLNSQDYVFANVASYNLHKGHYVMANAMEMLLKRRRDVKIVCVGNVVYRPHFEALQKHLTERGLNEHILLPGFFPDVENVHAMSDAFLLPSFIEGWSIAMNEAMFYEKPMILTDTGASSEVIEANDIGMVVPNEYGDVSELTCELLDELAYTPRNYKLAPVLAQAMDEMASNRSEWHERGKGGRRKIYSTLDFAGIVRRYERVIENVIQNAS